jgi:hypothetical protein
MIDRCDRCPTPTSVPCRGLAVRRYCELIDPACPAYDARFVDVIVRESDPTTHDPAALDRAYADHGTAPARGGCCQ